MKFNRNNNVKLSYILKSSKDKRKSEYKIKYQNFIYFSYNKKDYVKTYYSNKKNDYLYQRWFDKKRFDFVIIEKTRSKDEK